MAEPIDFYFDFSSPYGYFASTCIDRIAGDHGRAVAWRPILLGAAMKVTGGKPMIAIPLRAEYMARDLPRFARYLGVPFCMPEPFPIAAIAASRAFYWMQARDAQAAHRLAQALFRTYFGIGQDISKPQQVAAVARELGLDADALADGIAAPEVKQTLRDETDAAIEKGVFGSPYVIVDGEPFWGADRLNQLEAWLARGGF